MTLNELAVYLGGCAFCFIIGISLIILACASRNGNRASQRYQSCNTGRLTINQIKQRGVKDVRND